MEYRLIDSGEFEKLEQVGPFKLVRPSPQAVWSRSFPKGQWGDVDARFDRFSGGEGAWSVHNIDVKTPWSVEVDGIQVELQLTDFGHLGIFAEQRDNWRKTAELISGARAPVKLLNLFAYTGIQSLFAAAAGAEVVHLDASKTSVAWARRNAELSGLADKPIRWIVDDVQKFVSREIRRESHYDAIVLDPPSFGRGAKGQVWKIEEHLVPLLDQCRQLLSSRPLFVLLCSHSQGYTPIALKNLLTSALKGISGEFEFSEMTVTENHGRALPSGACCLFRTT